MSVDVMIVGPAEDIARPASLEIMEWLHERWQEFEIPYGFIEFEAADIQELESRFANDPVGQILLKKITLPDSTSQAMGMNSTCPTPWN